MADSCNVRVYARFRPLNQREQALGEQATKDLAFKGSTDVTCTGHTFSFDGVFGPDSQQEGIYQAVAASTVDDLFVGFNGTIFAYGQTGAGKSFTMMGVLDDGALAGVIPRATRHIFATIDEAPTDVSFKVSVSYLEVYREVIRDLLDTRNTNLAVRESKTRGTYVEGCATIGVATEAEVHQVIQLGDAARAVGATNMNAHSSRSHSVLIIKVEQQSSSGAVKTGVLNLVDLAGSERAGKTGASGQRMEEAKKINQSLSALSNVISSLADGKAHIPFRDSKLTRMLQQSLGGNCKTALVVACSPHDDNSAETLSTLRFGQRAKAIKTKVKVNEQKSVEELTQLVEMLRAELAASKRSVSALKAALQAAGLPLPDLGADAAEAGGGGDDDAGGGGAGMTALEAGAMEKLQLDYRQVVDEREMLGQEMAEAKAELQSTQQERDATSEEFAKYLARRKSEVDIAKRMAAEVLQLREEAGRKNEMAVVAVKTIKDLRRELAEGGGGGAVAAEASAVLEQEQAERVRAAEEETQTARAECEGLREEVKELKARLAASEAQAQEKEQALSRAVASGQQNLKAGQAKKMYSTAAKLSKIRGQGESAMADLMKKAGASKAVTGGRARTKSGKDFGEMLQKMGSATATDARGAKRRASLDALLQSSQAAAAAVAASAAASKAAEENTVPEQDEEEEEGTGSDEELTIGDRIDDALDESFVDAAAIGSLLGEAEATRCAHPGLPALQAKLANLKGAEEGVPPA